MNPKIPYDKSQYTNINDYNQYVMPVTNQFTTYQNMSKINQAYSQNTPLIDKQNFNNQNNTLHNNLSDKLNNEYVMEYKISLYSEDRNRKEYPSPFNFVVNCKKLLQRDFENIKYITLDSILLPRTYAIDTTHVVYDNDNNASGNIYPTSSDYSPDAEPSNSIMTTLKNHKYLILNIDEIENNETNLDTNRKEPSKTFILYKDKHCGMDSELWKPIHSTIVYQSSTPLNVSKLTIRIFDENGKELNLVDEEGNKITPTYNSYNNNFHYNAYVKEHKYNNESVAYTDTVSQVSVFLVFGIIKQELATLVSHNR